VLEELDIMFAPPAFVDVLVAAPRRALRTLKTRSCNALDRLDASAPRLHHLEMRTGEPVGELRHAALRKLVADSFACPCVCDGRFELPALEALVWEPRDLQTLDEGEPESDEPESDPIFGERSILFRPPPSLRSLELTGISMISIQHLANSRALAQASSLRVHTNIGGVLGLIDHAGAYRHLEILEILEIGIWRLEPNEIRDLRERVEKALPAAKIDWSEHEPVARIPIDAESQRPDGTIDAIPAGKRR
jgi:hypothetical protein